MKFIVLLACFVLSTNVFASGISSSQLAVNTVAFHEAEEDYRFGDFEVAIPKLEALHRQYPQDATIVQYLADSYTSTSHTLNFFKALKVQSQEGVKLLLIVGISFTETIFDCSFKFRELFIIV